VNDSELHDIADAAEVREALKDPATVRLVTALESVMAVLGPAVSLDVYAKVFRCGDE
jgi:actin-like ATPase involved in cell morphogenesis